MKKLFSCLLGLALLAVVFSASAAAPVYKWRLNNSGNYNFPTPAAACQSYAGVIYSHIVKTNEISYSCWSTNPPDFPTPASRGTANGSLFCADGGTRNTSKPLAEQCADPAPQCVPYRESTVTVSAGFKVPGTNTTSDMKAPKNINGCAVLSGGLSVEGCKSAPTGEVFCTWRVTETGGVPPVGEAPTQSATIPSTATPDKVPEHNPAVGQGCPKGTVSLGIDSTGGSICGGSGTSPSSPEKTEVKQPPVTTQNPDGGSTKTDVTTRTNSDGSTTTTTKTTTTGADGKVTTKEGSVTGSKPTGAGGSAGGAGKDDSSDDKKDDFCAKHPELNACKNSSVSGECESTACEGDAIQCSILRQQRKTYCELTKPDAMSELGQQIMFGNDPLKSTFPTKENARLVEIPQLNKNGFLGAGSCFPDVSFSLQGQQFTLPISKLCDYLIVFRGVIMLMASLASWKIISRSILG